MTVIEWANLPNAESDYMIQKLANKRFDENMNEVDLIVAKDLVRQRFVVGLMEETEESVRRFNVAYNDDKEEEGGAGGADEEFVLSRFWSGNSSILGAMLSV